MLCIKGNDNEDACNQIPANSDNAITVGAFDKERQKSEFSNYGDCVNIWSSGSSIFSAIAANNDYSYGYKSGTSMATPYISGLVANLLYINPSLNYDEIKTILLTETINIDGSVCNNKYECNAVLYKCESSTIKDTEIHLSTLDIVLIVLGVIAASLLLFCLILYVWKRRHFHRERKEKNNLKQKQQKSLAQQNKEIETQHIINTNEDNINETN